MKKHKNDVFRLFPLAEPTVQIAITSAVKVDVEQFINAMKIDSIDLERLGIEGMPLEEILRTLKRMFVVF